jgi:AcrR family transcriptional regulator
MSLVEQTGRTAQPVRQRLLTAAEDLFYAHGIASVGVDAVVARAGVATASLYKNFGGKDGLVAGYLQARDERWRRHWEAHIEQQSDPRECALAVFTALETWNPGHGSNNGCAHLAALQQLPEDHPGAAASRSHKDYMLDRFRQLVTEAGCPEPEETATDLLLIYEGTLALQATRHRTKAVRRGRRLARLRLDNTNQRL